MRIVIDTNILVSGLLWGGSPHQIVQMIFAVTVQLVSGEALLNELEDVLRRPKFEARFREINQDVERTIASIHRRAELVNVQDIEMVIEADPDDDMVLACAVAGQAEVIVSGDRHLKEVESYRGIPVKTAKAFLDELLEE